MERKDLYDEATFEDICSRIGSLTGDTKPEWGSMTVAQMLAHCAEVQDVANGKDLKGTPFMVKLMGGMIKKMVTSDKPYPKNSRTHPQYVMRDPEDFDRQKDRLLHSLRFMHALGRKESRHPLFGKWTAEDKSWAMYKHLDHHLTQFGV